MSNLGFVNLTIGQDDRNPSRINFGFSNLTFNDEFAYTIIVENALGDRLSAANIAVSNLVNDDSYNVTGNVNGAYLVSTFIDWQVDSNGFLVPNGILDTVLDITALGYNSEQRTIVNADGFGGTIIVVLGVSAKMCSRDDFSLAPILKPPSLREVCICDFGGCEYKENVLVDLLDDDHFKNDQSSFLIQRFPAQAVDVFLYKGEAEIAQITDDTYGAYYPSFIANDLLTGVVLDWRTVVAAFGHGTYTLRYSLDGGNLEMSRMFQTANYSPITADQTVRMTVFQDGNTINGIDYTDLLSGGWRQDFRIPGQLKEVAPTYENDVYLLGGGQDQRYRQESIQKTTVRNYELETYLIPDIVYDLILEGIKSNTILLSDYKVATPTVFRDLSVTVESFSELNASPNSFDYTAKLAFNNKALNDRQVRF